jgi:FkbM family methyltransferase
LLIPKWMKRNSVYPLGRNAILSLIGSPRFYNPLSAIQYCVPEYEHVANVESLIRDIRVIEEKEGLTIWRTPLGDLATPSTQILDNIAFLIDEFCRNVYLCGPVRIAPGSVVLDIGGNVGLFAKQAIRLSARQVICLEPVPENIRALRRNLASELSMNRVTILAKGVWDKIDALRIRVDPKHPTCSSFVEILSEADTYEVTINVEPIDLIVKELELPCVDFVKMDIEGAELKALHGAREVLLRHKPQLAIAVEHTSDRLRNAGLVRDLVLSINPTYRCIPGPYSISNQWRLLPDILYFK